MLACLAAPLLLSAQRTHAWDRVSHAANERVRGQSYVARVPYRRRRLPGMRLAGVRPRHSGRDFDNVCHPALVITRDLFASRVGPLWAAVNSFVACEQYFGL